MTHRSIVPALALGIAAAGCASYYKVTEPASGKEFYTQEVSRKIGGSAIEFKDAKNGAITTLQNSQVLEIDEKTYKAGLAAAKAAPAASPAAAPPTPAPAPAPTPQ